MANVIYFSVIELLCGFSPNYTFFLVMRALFGIGMGGEWGVGASLAMEAAPREAGAGCSAAYCRADTRSDICWRRSRRDFFLPAWGWRAMFWVGAAPGAAGAVYPDQGSGVGSVEAASRREHGQVLRVVGRAVEALRVPRGADDLHDVSLARHAGPLSGFPAGSASSVSAAARANIAMIYNSARLCGAIIFGHFSQTRGGAKVWSRRWDFAGW